MKIKNLYLLRHAKAEAGHAGMEDQTRSLAPRGREACLAMGQLLVQKGYIPEFAMISPAARTVETAERVMLASGKSWKIKLMGKLYLASAATMIDHIHSVAEEITSLMLVGHNPGMHHVALELASREPEALRHALEMKYPTCALTVLQFSGSWAEVKQGQGKLVDFLTPGDMDG